MGEQVAASLKKENIGKKTEFGETSEVLVLKEIIYTLRYRLTTI